MMVTGLPQHEVSTLGADTLRLLDGKTFALRDDGAELPCRLKLLPSAQTLFVMLNGAVDRSKVALPVFARWNWGKVLGGHVLSVCDPTLYLDDQLRLGWFVGNESFDPMQALLRAVDACRTLLGIAPGRVIFYGSSGGGFASMVAAASGAHGRAIVVNPQTEITAYYPKAVDRIAGVFAPGLSAEQCRAQYPLRWSALAAVTEAKRLGRDLRIVYAQNLDDRVHHAKHFLPFCATTESPADGGLSVHQDMLTHVYASPEGHGAEPPEVVKYIVAHGLPHLLGGPAGTP